MEIIKSDNIDIESCKELFEYEMTEVILKLKGEFASVSGKDTKYATVAIDEQHLQISPVSIPEVVLEDSAPSFAECETPAYVVALPKCALSIYKAMLPHIPVPNLRETENVQIEKQQINASPSVVKTHASIPDAQFELCSFPQINTPILQKSFGNIGAVEVSLLKVKEPQAFGMAFSGLLQYELKFPSINSPYIPSISLQSDTDIQVAKTKINAPRTTTMPCADVPEVQIKACLLHSFKPRSIRPSLVTKPNVNRSTLQRADVKKTNVGSIATPIIKSKNISVPSIPKIHQKPTTNVLDYKISTFPIGFLNVGSVDIPNMKESLSNCNFEAKINKDRTVTVPEIPGVHIEQVAVSPVKVFSFNQPKKIKATKQLATVATKSALVKVPSVSTCAVNFPASNTKSQQIDIGVVCPVIGNLNKPFTDVVINISNNLAIPTTTDISALRQEASLIASKTL